MTAGTPFEDFDLAAAEYVLGTLDAAERSAFAARLRSDADAARAVRAWERRFAGLEAAVAPLTPPGHVWPAIERALQPTSTPAAPAFRVVEGGRPAAVTPDLARSRNRWRASALAFGAVAAALVAFIAVDRSAHIAVPQGPGGSYVAAITRGGDQPAMLVRVDLGTRRVFVLPIAAKAPPDHSLELWYIGDDKKPVAMGLVDKQPSSLAAPQDAIAGATFAVSVEPPGGSTTGGPTGPVVYSGQLVKEEVGKE